MDLAKNVTLVKVEDETECFVCERVIESGALTIQVKFNVHVPIAGAIPVKKCMHIACGGELYMLLGERLAQSRRMK